MLRVILIDDEPSVLVGLKLLIDWRQNNAEICGCFTQPRQALAAAEALQPDLIITDIEMPEISGLDLIASLRTVCPSATCVILSAYSDFQYAQQAVSLGVYRYLLKPLPDIELENLLADVSSLHFKVSPQSFIRSLVAKEILINGTDFHHTSTLPNYQDFYHTASFLLVFLQPIAETLSSEPFPDTLRKKLAPVCSFQLDQNWIILIDACCNSSVLQELEDHCRDICTLELSAPFVGLQEGHTILRQFRLRSYASRDQQVQDMFDDPLFENSQQIIQQAMSYIRTHYMEPEFKLSSIADELFVNYSYLSHIFKRKTGKTLSNYLLDLRMEEAQTLLRYSGLSVTEISYRVGYPIPKNFFQAFKKYHNESPKSYRKRYMNQA